MGYVPNGAVREGQRRAVRLLPMARAWVQKIFLLKNALRATENRKA
jgi:hypothetical protein